MKYALLLLFLSSTVSWSQSILEKNDLVSYQGFFNSYYVEQEDKIYLDVHHLDSSFIYISALSQGIGNNDLLLDRGQLGETRIVQFKKAGNRLLLVQPNLKYRAITTNSLERRSVEEAFAKSVLFGFEILEKTKLGYLIDLTPFLLRDAHGVVQVLKGNDQGDYKLDLGRSALNMERTKSFPKNVDFDALITLSGDPKGNEIKSVTPDAQYVSMYQHHSFVELPDDQFKPRKAHPNSGSITTQYYDYSSPIGSPMKVRYSLRHRLEKKNPDANKSEAIEPIVYYLDNGTPEPIRSALLEGASWWNEAFEAIGFVDAFQVKILPDSIDPLDVRYNVIQWVHRSTRGWSYGGGVVDPRTGEIIKGHVSLGSLRVRQDYKIAKALTNNASEEILSEFALSRIRQLSAHEVGHTLGFTHNFAASAKDRASVMDYPHPWVQVQKGKIDLSNAYAKGIGDWDKVTVAYSYSELAENEDLQLEKIIENAMNNGHRFISDDAARPLGGSNAFGHLWDNGSNPRDELVNVLEVRRVAIEQFDEAAINSGETYAELEDLFVLLYFYHRYQTEAVIKLIGGREYGYHVKGGSELRSIPVTADEQKRALEIILLTIDPTTLAIPGEILQLLPDRSDWWQRDRESFTTMTGPTFDPIAASKAATDFVLTILLAPERVNRLVMQSSMDSDQLSLEETLRQLLKQKLPISKKGSYEASIRHAIDQTILNHLMSLSQSDQLYAESRAIIMDQLQEYHNRLMGDKEASANQRALIRSIEQFFKDPTKAPQAKSVKVPDGSPIGMYSCSP